MVKSYANTQASEPCKSKNSARSEAVRQFVLSASFQCGVQLMVGMIVVTLFIFVRDLSFPQACLSATLYIVCSLLVSPDTNVGTKLTGCSMVLGAFTIGAIFAGCLVSIAKQVDGWQPQLAVLFNNKKLPPNSHAGEHYDGYTALLLCLAVVGLAVLSVNRVGQHPPFLWGLGMTSCLSYGTVFVTTQFIPDVPTVWRQVIAYLMADVTIAAAVAIAVAVLVLPRLAIHELQSCISITTSGIGGAVSRYASRLTVQDPSLRSFSHFRRTTSQHVTIKVGSGGVSSTDDDVEIYDNEIDDEAFVEMLQQLTRPGGALGSANPSVQGGMSSTRPHIGAPASVLWPNLNRAKVCVPSAMAEPALMTGTPFSPAVWGRVIAATEELLARASALELLLEEKAQVLDSSSMLQYFGADRVPVFQLALGQVAAGCANVGLLLNPHKKCQMKIIGKETWASTKEELRTSITSVYNKYWKKIITSTDKHSIRLPDAMRVRAIFFAGVLTNGLVEAIENLEAAVEAALAHGTEPQTFISRIKGHVAFTHAPLQIILGIPMWGNWVHCAVYVIPPLFTRKGLRTTLRSRTFQAGVKYWLALSTTLLLILGLSSREDVTQVRQYRPVFGYLAAALSMSEKVEATISKVSVWVLGSTVGGLLGWLTMLHSSLATNPYALMVIICAFTLLTGFGVALNFRIAMVLTLMTFLGMILCQYKGCCDATGSTPYFAARVLSVVLGCSIPVLLSNLILPWFNSQWALEVLGRTFQEAVTAAEDAYDICYFEGAQAVRDTAKQQQRQAVAAAAAEAAAVKTTAADVASAAAGAAADVRSAASTAAGGSPQGAGPVAEGVEAEGGKQVQAAASAAGTGTESATAAVVGSGTAITSTDPNTGTAVTSTLHVDDAAVTSTEANNDAGVASTEASNDAAVASIDPNTSSATALWSDIDSRATAPSPDANNHVTAVSPTSTTSARESATSTDPNNFTAVEVTAPHTPPTSAEARISSGGGTVSGRPSTEVPPNIAAALAGMKAPLRQRIALPLVGVQVGLIKDGVLWQRGLLATPPMVVKLMIPMFGLLDRLTALQLTLSKPNLTGKFNGWAFDRVLSPVHADFKDILETMHTMAAVTAKLLVCRADEKAALSKELKEAIRQLEERRLIIRTHIVQGRRALVKEVLSRLVHPSTLKDYVAHPDDFVRVLGFLFAFVKTVDRATTIARVALNCSSTYVDDGLAWVK